MPKKLYNFNFDSIIQLIRDEKFSHIYHVQINKIEELKKLSSFECHFILYPYDREINSTHLIFKPYEEYVNELVTDRRSIYHKIVDSANKWFGLTLGGLIVLFFATLQPKSLLSVEAIVSIFGAYTIGKEIWYDLHKMLIKITRNFKLTYFDDYYSYQLEKRTTLARYTNLAKMNRYPSFPILPQKIDFIEQSNSQSLRMFFSKSDLEHVKSNSAHLFSIHIKPKVAEKFERNGFMFGVKLSLNKQAFKVKKSYELFQSINGKLTGSLNDDDEWVNDSIFFRKTYTYGKLKYFKSKGIIKDKFMISM